MTYSIQLPTPHLLGKQYQKQVTFNAVSCAYRHRVSTAVSHGSPLCKESYSLVYPVLTDAELAVIEGVFNIQDIDVRLVWTPEHVESFQEFLPPKTWKLSRFRLECVVPLPVSKPYPETSYRTKLEFTLDRLVFPDKL